MKHKIFSKFIFKAVILIGFAQNAALAQSQNQPDTVRLMLEFPFVDAPFQYYASKTTGNILSAYANPSMAQSLALSNNFYSSAHYAIKKLIKSKDNFLKILLQNSIAAGFDFISFYVPLGVGWFHEEYHRAVMTRREINSFNDMNTFPIGKTAVYVSNIKDEDLIRLHNNHNADFIRLQSAGLEAQYHQIQSLQKQNFYYNQGLPHIPLYWLSTINNIDYVMNCGTVGGQFDEEIDKMNQREAKISERDFTGPDFTAWSKALFNPNTLYEARGIHPLGNGINRYIKPSQLSPQELDYLKKQGNLQLLNLLSPHLFGFPKFKLKSGENGNYYGSFAVRHLLTSFGNDISLDIFYQTPKHNLFFTLHNYNNRDNAFWGLEASILDKRVINDKLLVSGRSMLWAQPKNQSFQTSESSLGGLVGLRGAYEVGEIWFPYLELEAKTKGWVMGNVFLEENISVRAGLSARIK